MSRPALTKLVFVMILAFIVCLPEFFTVHRVSSVSLRCELSDLWRNNTCLEQWEHLSSRAANQRNTTEADMNCFVCEADVKMAGFDDNSSSSAHNIHLEVWLHLHLTNPPSVNLTLFGHYNHTSLQLQLSNQPEECDRTQNNNGLTKDLLHCAPSPDTANHSRCLLWLSNQTFTTAKGRLPWKRTTGDEWRCVVRVVWLTLLCVVLLFIIITVIGEIYRDTRGSDKAKILPLNYNIQGQQVMNQSSLSVVQDFSTYIPHFCSALSTIEEVDAPDEIKMLNRNVDHGQDPSYPPTDFGTTEDPL